VVWCAVPRYGVVCLFTSVAEGKMGMVQCVELYLYLLLHRGTERRRICHYLLR
jgi:hypothetical protein